MGRVLAFGVMHEPVPVPCPECAGLQITPASADDQELRTYSATDVLDILMRHPALPPPIEVEAPAG
jgi:hypothetical protein